MADYALEILDRYDLKVHKTNRIRGGFLCDTNKGYFAILEYTGTKRRLEFQKKLLDEMERQQVIHVDWILPDQEEKLSNQASDGKEYLLRRWYGGKEADLQKVREVCQLSQALAMVHELYQYWQKLPQAGEWTEPSPKCGCILEKYKRYQAEMKRASRYIERKSRKQDFERMLLKEYESFARMADASLAGIEQAEKELWHKSPEKFTRLRHGNYTYHSLCINGMERYVSGCGMARTDLQLKDLYTLIRKSMEKTNWNWDTGKTLLSGYEGFLPLTKEERQLLSAMLAFPYKYWKILNRYMNSGKAWIPEQSRTKLERILEQRKKKEDYLKQLFQ